MPEDAIMLANPHNPSLEQLERQLREQFGRELTAREKLYLEWSDGCRDRYASEDPDDAVAIETTLMPFGKFPVA